MKSWILCTTFLGVAACTAGDVESEGPPWVELFDGETLDGWVTKGGRYDGDARWTVEDGVIVGRVGPGKAGGLLYTAELYDDFEIELECRIDYPFDSGVFVRMVPDGLKGAQLTLDYRPDGQVGGVYADGWLLENPDGKARFRRDAWNHVRLRCTGSPGMELEAWLNGEPLVAYRLPDADRAAYAASGRIGVQVHGGRDEGEAQAARFRAVRIRRL